MRGEPMVDKPFAVVFALVSARLENRQREQHEQTYRESDQAGDRFSVHGSSSFSHCAIAGDEYILGHRSAAVNRRRWRADAPLARAMF
jgi:hypothetical protein